MNPERKLALRRWTIRQLRKLLDFLDDRLHAAEVELREEIADKQFCGGVGVMPVHTAIARKRPTVTDETEQEKPLHGLTRRRRGKTAAEFDLSLASRSMPLRFSS